jgi:uncharacterized protein (TIRG00374 family)
MVKHLLRYAKKILPLIGILIFLYLIYTLDISKIQESILSIPPIILLLSLVLTLPRILLRNYAWQLIQREQHISISFFQSLKVFLIGFFYGSITPAYIGQLMRVPYLKEKTSEPYGKLFINSVIENIIHTLSLYGMMLLGALLAFGTIPELFWLTIIWIIILAVILLYFMNRNRGEQVFNFLIRLLIPRKIKSHFHRFVDTFYDDFPRNIKLIVPLLIGLFTWIIVFSQEYLIVHALGLDIPYHYFLLLFPIANVAGFLPITFAGLGTRELTSIFLFSTLFGVAEESVFVFTIMGFLVTDVFTGFIGFLASLTEARDKKIDFI